MGIFGNKKQKSDSPEEEAREVASQIFDDQFREYLRDRGRLYFERVIEENANLFKQDLDATVAHINTELRQHMARQLDDQFIEIKKLNEDLRADASRKLDEQFSTYTQSVKEAQENAMKSLEDSAKIVEEQHAKIQASLEKSVANQDAILVGAVEDSKKRIDDMKAVQDKAIESLEKSVQTLESQHKELSEALDKSVAKQKAIIVDAFEQNMSQIVEHYLLEAVGNEFDLKTQLPSIIKRLEGSKQDIVDDMKL